MNLLDLYAKISLDDSEYNKGIDDASGKASSFAQKLKSGLQKTAKIGGAALGAASAAVGALTKASIDNYAEYEQLVGGVETLFKDSASKVIGYAENAYKTAGMSANEYMNTVTSFSASLLQSLDGDTDKAASVANRAITDMSDNANKMGTSMEMIQNAYNGFAKQNYTMLDNLKLGYGGTKEEMARLIEDASRMTDVQRDLGIEVEAGNMSFGNIANAISVVQKEMGIMGTTEKEASSTIQGSISSMKSAWQNLVTSIGDENANVSANMETFVDTVVTAAGNIIPRIGIILQNIGPIIAGLAPIIAEQLPGIIETLVPSLIQAAASLVGALVQNLPTILSSLFTAISSVVDSLIGGLGDQFPFLTNILNTLKDVIPIVVAAFVAYEAITKGVAVAQGVLNAVMNANPFVLVATLIAGLVAALVTLWNTNDGFREAVTKIWDAIKGVFIGAWNGIKAVWDTVAGFFSGVWEGIKGVFSSVSSVLSGFFSSAWNAIKGVWNVVVNFFQTIWNNIKAVFSVVKSVLTGDFSGAWEGIKNIFSNVRSFFSNVWTTIKNVFSDVGQHFLNVGKSIVQGLWNGIQSLAGWIWDKVFGWISGIWDGICGFFGIHSPSTEMAWVGKMLVKGLAGSIQENGDQAVDAASKMADDVLGTMDDLAGKMAGEFSSDFSVNGAGNISGGAYGYGESASWMYGSTITINVNGANIQDDQKLAEKISFELQMLMDRRAAVYGA